MTTKLKFILLEPKQTDPKLIRSELHQAGLTPEYCFVKNLDELKAVLDADIDLVLAEYNLPASDGIEALRILRDHHLDIPLVFFSKSGGEDSIVHALKLGAADFVSTKNLSRLGPAVRRALEEKWVQRQKQASEDLIWITSRLPEENPNPVLRVDSDAVILYANPASKPLLDHWGREMGQALPAEWIRHIAAALDRGSNHEIELECGQKFFSLMLAPAVSDRCVNIFARDITADRHAAQALRNANQAIESSINAIAIGDLDGRLTHVNPSFLRMWGYSDPSEVLGRDVGEFLETEGQIRSGITTQSENRSWVGEIPARRKDGSLFDVQVSASMIIGDMGLPVGQMASFLDITARKQDAALQDAVYRIANITETTRSLSDLFQQIHVIISSVMPAENFFITLYDEKENTLRFPYFKDALDEPYINQLQPGKGLTAYVLRTGESLLCTQEVHNDLQARGEVILLGVPSAIWLGVPLVTDGKTIGVMVVQHYTDPNAYGKREQHILEFVSSQVAFAITRKQAEEALRNNEERYRALIENTSDMIAIVNPDGVVSYISPAVERVLGYEQKKVLGQSIFQIVHAEHLNAASRSMAHRARTAGLAPAAVEVRARHKNGEWRDLEVLANNLLHDPAVGGLVMNARDITERKRAQQKNLQLAAIVQSSEDAIISSDLDGLILSWNEGATKIYGYTEEEVIGKSVSMLMPPETKQDFSMIFEKIKMGESLEHYETIRLRKNGERFFVSLTASPIRDLEGNVVASAAISHDITQRRQAEQKIRQQLERLTALNEIDRTITSSFDLRLSLGVLLTNVLKQLAVDAADVLIFHPGSQMLEFAAGRGFRNKISERTKLRMGESHAGRVAAERRMVHVSNLKDSREELFSNGTLAGEGLVGYYGIPLIAKGNVKGVLEVFTRSQVEHDEEWLYFLTILSEQAAIAIDNLTLFDDLQRSNSELMLAYETTLEGWSHALDLRDKETEGHTRRVVEMSLELARYFGFTDTQLAHVRRGALLHDIGKMGLPDHVLLKPEQLTREEEQLMHMHPVYAYEMLSQITYLRDALDIPYCHHEKWDGSGYPRGLKGEHIPLAARIFAVVDVWDALTSDRTYRRAWSAEKAREHIKSLAGSHFDPKVVEVFIKQFAIK